ncbi:hypothetical protein [Novosphingobium lentum]|nr:hypothetical protein [Novosphingobium lentum]
MTAIRTFSSQLIAAATALTLSFALISATVSTPSTAPAAASAQSEMVA